MARGKQTCKILKDIRRQIAEANDIEFVTSECRYKGDCLGTCPKCEAELRYLEERLRARSLSGKAVAIAGISAGMLLMFGCSNSSSDQENETLQGEPVEEIFELPPEPGEIVEGDIEEVEGEVISEDSVGSTINDDTDSHPATEDEINLGRLVLGEISEYEPEFPGGAEKLYEWISQHIIYPQSAIDANISGSVLVVFHVGKDGSVENANVSMGVNDDLDKEALRVVRALPKFKPATRDGAEIPSRYAVRVTFRLND